jgi:hypothetical protein
MKRLGLVFVGVVCSVSIITGVFGESVKLSKAELKDRIRGSWAGQVIGCTYGGPTEFRWRSAFIPEHVPIEWNDSLIEWWYDNAPGLYDDVYMDLTFVQVFEEKGLSAPAAEFAKAFAYAEYPLWHANNMARYNIKHGLMPPESGHWMNNPHADDIDYQIEADFSGIMAPGMPNTSAEISDKIGHIMNYGDGWYGGVYVGAMYSLAFVRDDIDQVVKEALNVIPKESQYHQAMTDVIRWHQQYPDDWKQTWLEVQRKWGRDVGCPDGALTTFNIDALMNSAWIVLGLLYGEEDFGKTLEISTRAGDDSDCNPASAGGILGCLVGYDAIPDYWKQGLDKVEDRDFQYTTMSLNETYEISMRHAEEVIRRNDGIVEVDSVEIAVQEPKPVRLEKGFENLVPVKRTGLNTKFMNEASFDFEGTGFAVNAGVQRRGEEDVVLDVEMWVDGKLAETAKLYSKYIERRESAFWRYNLPNGKHVVRLKVKDPSEDAVVELNDLVVYRGAN